MFVGIAINLTGRLLASASPAALFANGEVGVWYDPSDITTLFQDSAGTTPVTAPNQPVGKMLDKSGRGNHATQATSTQRPIYGINPITGTRNLLRDMSQAYTGWVAAGTTPPTLAMSQTYLGELCTAVTFTSAMTATYAGTRVSQTGALGASVALGNTYTTSYYLSLSRALVGGEQIAVFFTGNTGLSELLLTATNTASLVGSFERRSNSSTPSLGSSGTDYPYVYLKGAMTSDVTLYINKIQIESGSTVTAYQKVVSQYEVTEAGVQSASYLAFDGVDDFMVTPTITPNTDKVQVFAGVRKLSDAAQGAIVESSTGAGNGRFSIFAPPSTLSGYQFNCRGTLASGGTTSGFAAPITSVVTAIGDISAPVATLRVNGSQVATYAGTQGTGNFLAYPLYIGRRGGATNPFNGRIYSMIVRFGANLTTGQITSTESWVNGKTGAY